jgi:glycosyltransferase involved in cell wall biosynthesis
MTDRLRGPRAGAALLQICPNDHPPFDDLCRLYASAAERLGVASRIVYLAPPRGDRDAHAEWLDQTDLARTGTVAAALRGRLAAAQHDLVLCHRYRAWTTWSRAGLQARRVIAIAHEFGFFRRLARRLKLRLPGMRTEFAGVSPAIVADLARTVPQPLLLPNGIDAQRIDWLERDAARAALGLSLDGFACAVLGRLHPKKRPMLALDGFLRAAEPVWQLVFVGDGELRGELEGAAAAAPARISFTGFVPEARRFLRAFDALLVTSAPVEAFGMVALEAMVAGVPVVAPRVPGLESVLDDCALYFTGDTSEAVAATLARVNTEGAVLAARAAQRAAAEFSLEATVGRLESLLA